MVPMILRYHMNLVLLQTWLPIITSQQQIIVQIQAIPTMLSEDYYGFSKKSPARPTHRTELSQQKLNNNRSRQKLQKLKQKYNQINNSNAGNRQKKQRGGRDRDKEKKTQRSRQKKIKFKPLHQYETQNQMRFRYFHYNEEPMGLNNELRKRVEKKAMESLEKDFNNRFNVPEGKSCVSQRNLKEAQELLTRRSRQVYLKQSLKSKNGENKKLITNGVRTQSHSQPHRILRKLKPQLTEQPSQQKNNDKDDDDSLDFDIENEKIKTLRQKKLAYSQKQSMLMGTLTLKKHKDVTNEVHKHYEPKQNIKQIFHESVISINSRHQNNQLKEQSMLKPDSKREEIATQPLATSDYELIKELEKRARDEESQASKQIEFNKIYPSSSSFSKSEANQNVQDSQSNTLSNVIKNSSDIMKRNLNLNDGASSHSSKFSLQKDSLKDSVSLSRGTLNNESKASSSEPIEKVKPGTEKQTDTSEKRQPLPAYYYDQFKLNARTYYQNNDNSSLNLSKSYHMEYFPYQHEQYHQSNSISLKSSGQNDQMLGSPQLIGQPVVKANVQTIKKGQESKQASTQINTSKSTPQFKQISFSNRGLESSGIKDIGASDESMKVKNSTNSISIDQYRQFMDNYYLTQSYGHQNSNRGVYASNNYSQHDSQVRQSEGDHQSNANESMDGHKFSFVLQSNPINLGISSTSNSPQQKEINVGLRQNVNVSSFNNENNNVITSITSIDGTSVPVHHSMQNNPKLPTNPLADSKAGEGLNQFISVPPNIFVRPSHENLEGSNNLLEAIKSLNEEEDKKICDLYTTLAYEDELQQRLMDKIYDHLACVNKILDFVADTEVFYVDRTQREMFHVCSYLLIKRFSEERLKIEEHLKEGRSCFNLTNKQITAAEVSQLTKTSSLNELINDLVSSNARIEQIMQSLYKRLHQQHSFLSPPQYPISQEDLITISQKLNEQLELLIQKIDDNQDPIRRSKGYVRASSSGSISKDNSFVRDNQYEALCVRAFGVMELMFLVSALEGRNVKKVENEIEPEDFEMYCKNNYGLFKQTILYFH